MSKYRDDITNDFEEYDNNVITADITSKEAKRLEKEQGVISVEKNITLSGLFNENDQITGLSEILKDSNVTYEELKKKDLEQWYLKAIGINKSVQNYARGCNDIKVELLDSGVSYTEDIDIQYRVNFVPGDENVSILYEDATGHGTSLAGIIGAKDNKIGITGINPNANIYSVKVLDDQNKSTLSRVIEGIYWGIENNMNIINMSFGTSVNSPALYKAIQDASSAGILLIAAAGNDESRRVQYPAAYPEVMAVGATNTAGRQIGEYASGDELEILAPGDGILGTGLFDGMVMNAGTSVSTAEITAIASLLWSKDSSKSADFIRSLMKTTGQKVRNSSSKDLKLVDCKKAFQNYDKFKGIYANGQNKHMESLENDKVSESYENTLVVNGLWASDKHKDIVNSYLNNESNIGSDAFAYLNSNRVQIMAATTYEADHTYKTTGSGLHGTGNYIQSCKFLFNCAQKVRAGNSVSSSVSSASSGLVSDNPTAMNNLILDTTNMLNDNMSSISSDETNPSVRYFKVLGFAIHCISDTFAHRAFVLEADMKAGDSSDFSNYSSFMEKVRARQIEYRDVDDYTTNLTVSASRKKYEDNPNRGATRFRDAKKGSCNLLRASLLKTGFSASWFRTPNYGTVLSMQNSYAE